MGLQDTLMVKKRKKKKTISFCLCGLGCMYTVIRHLSFREFANEEMQKDANKTDL